MQPGTAGPELYPGPTERLWAHWREPSRSSAIVEGAWGAVILAGIWAEWMQDGPSRGVAGSL